MGVAARLIVRDRVLIAVGAVLFAVASALLAVPVMLPDLDRYGIQVRCGTGYSSQLVQAVIDDQAPAAGVSATHVDQCRAALAQRRAWAAATAALAVVVFVPGLLRWANNRGGEPDSITAESTWRERPDTYLHEAAVLDRRERARHRSTNTTL